MQAQELNRILHDGFSGFIDDLPWKDYADAVEDFEGALSRLLAATHWYLSQWDEIEERLGLDEYSLSPSDIDVLPPEERLAYVARLAYSLALHYAHRPQYRDHVRVSKVEGGSPAALVHNVFNVVTGRQFDDFAAERNG